MKTIYISTDVADAALVGGKAAALLRLDAAGFTVPPFFAATGDASDEEILAALSLLPGSGALAVRSSAADEDGASHSFAGQLESYLFVSPDHVLTRVQQARQSGFSERATAYRAEHGLPPATAPAVLVQRMIDAEISGVAFAADPIGGSRSTLVISAVFGLGTALVGGDAEADTYRVRHDGTLLDQRIAKKTLRHVPDPAALTGVRAETVDDDAALRATLSATQVQEVLELVLRVSALEHRPQDIEFAFAAGKLFLLQARPITSLSAVADPDGARALWDNSNIAESYNGITTPLTFSFAQRAYDGAYRGFCKLMKVPRSVIADNDAMFTQMLGLIRGRIYYNLLNWYRLLAMLPGYSVNQRFMEQMMGVREGLPPEIAGAVLRQTWAQRQRARLRLAWSAAGLIWNHFVLPAKIRSFYARLNIALAKQNPPLSTLRLDQLAAEFRLLESRLLSRWDAPLINDFLAMIFFGVLAKTTAKWLGSASLHNDLISDEGGIISTEPVQRIAEMARLAQDEPALVDALCNENISSLHACIAAHATLGERYNAYLEKFGDRCLEELKLESATVIDDPTPLLRSIGQAARRAQSVDAVPYRPRAAAEAEVRRVLQRKPLKRFIYRWLLRHTRARVRDRENLRFERTRLFGRVRRIFVEAGRRLYAENLLEEARDVFYLTVNEILGYVEGTSVDVHLRELARRRRAEFERFRELPPPADRFETRGAVYLGNSFATTGAPQAAPKDALMLHGVGCCPGVVRGRVRVIREPRGATIEQGEILVAERTDPGWVMLFPAAAGVLVERGSVLSHSAIVARELGIPAIVSIPELLARLVDGQTVEMNGATGEIQIIQPVNP